MVCQFLLYNQVNQLYIYICSHISSLLHLPPSHMMPFLVHKFFLLFFLNKFIYLFLVALGLCCCTRAFSNCGERRLLFVAVRGLLIAVACPVAENGLQVRGLHQLWHAGSGAQAQQLWRMGLVALWHVGFSRTRAGTHVPCIGRRILNHCATREVQDVQI